MLASHQDLTAVILAHWFFLRTRPHHQPATDKHNDDRARRDLRHIQDYVSINRQSQREQNVPELQLELTNDELLSTTRAVRKRQI